MADKIIVNDITETAAVAALSTDNAGAPKRRAKTKTAKVGKSDKFIWGVYIFLLIISIIESYSASSSIVKADNIYRPLLDQVMYLGIGFGIVLGLQKLHYKWFKKYAAFVFVVSVLALLYATFNGVDVNDAKRAIRIAGITIQPPEIVKLTTVLFLAMLLSRGQEPGGVKSTAVFWAALSVLVLSGLLWVNGLTNAMLLMAVSGSMFIIGGIQWRKLGVVVLVYAAFGGVVYEMKYADKDKAETSQFSQVGGAATERETGAGRSATHKNRIQAFIGGISPDDTITDDNRQVMFAQFAQARGGIIGNGPGNSRESARLPLAFSDYIFSIIVEDIGFIGGVALLALYLSLIARAGYVASKCSRAFPALLIMGCAVLVALQACIHMIIVVGGPVSGQPLPLISKGGTSILVMSAAFGMMLSVSKFAVRSGNNRDVKAELEALPEDMRAANPSQIN